MDNSEVLLEILSNIAGSKMQKTLDAGLPCKIPNCNGILVSGFILKDKIFVETCSICGKMFDKKGNQVFPNWAPQVAQEKTPCGKLSVTMRAGRSRPAKKLGPGRGRSTDTRPTPTFGHSAHTRTLTESRGW